MRELRSLAPEESLFVLPGLAGDCTDNRGSCGGGTIGASLSAPPLRTAPSVICSLEVISPASGFVSTGGPFAAGKELACTDGAGGAGGDASGCGLEGAVAGAGTGVAAWSGGVDGAGTGVIAIRS